MQASGFRWLWRNPTVSIGALVLIGWILVSLLAPLLAPYPPLKQDIRNRLQPPSTNHLFGTDQLGRDILSRVIYGGRISLPIGITLVILGAALGTLLGAIAGYSGGVIDDLISRLTELFQAFPIIILAMTIAAALGPGLSHAMLAMLVVWWPGYARIVRSLVLSVKQQDFVTASRALGARDSYLLGRVVLRNCISPVVVVATLDLGNAILIFAALSFLGLGSPPPAPEWGKMVADGLEAFDRWWIAAFPGLAIFTVALAANFIGDALRDAMDPRLRRSLGRG